MGREAKRQADIAKLGAYESGHDAPVRATEAAVAQADTARSVVLVEGITDQIAVDTMLARLGRDEDAEGIVVVPIGGAQAAKLYVGRFSARPQVRVTGMCDEQEQNFYSAAFAAHGLGDDSFTVCAPDLEGELIAAFEPSELEALIDAEGELGSFRTLQKQAPWRDRQFDQQMHRWIRAKARRSSRYAKLLVEAVAEARIPNPLTDLVLAIDGN